MRTLAVILARAGSKGLPDKNILPLLGRPLICRSIDHALNARTLDAVVISTDGPHIARAAREHLQAAAPARPWLIVDRPADLASDTAPVDAAARHAVAQAEAQLADDPSQPQPFDAIVILYANVPIRPDDLIDRALAKLAATNCDSVQSLAPVGKNHPYWMKTLAGDDGDHLQPFIENTIDRRQSLPPVYMLDGGIIAVTRAALFAPAPGHPHAFLGQDRRAVITAPNDVVDIDETKDLALAQALLSHEAPVQRQSPHQPLTHPWWSTWRHRTWVIAELGVNHDGSAERAIELVEAAHDAGADAVKLQLFDPDLLLSAQATLADYQQAHEHDAHEMLRRLQLSPDDMHRVAAHARSRGLAFVVTCFSLGHVDIVRSLEPDAVKTASPDVVNTPLIHALADLHLPMIISTGGAALHELHAHAALWSHLRARQPLAMLACVSAYPTPPQQACLHRIKHIAPFCDAAGYSDHTTSTLTGATALAAALTHTPERRFILEKHLTHDRQAPGPDHAASLDPPQLAAYIAHVREAQTLLPSREDDDEQTPARPGAFDAPLPVEHEVMRIARQSLCAARPLRKGQTLSKDDLLIKRPGFGLPAAMLNQAIGSTLTRDIPANHLLMPGDIE